MFRFSAVIAGAALALAACGSDGDLSSSNQVPVPTAGNSVVPTGGGDWCDFAADSGAVDPMFTGMTGAPDQVKADVAKVEQAIVRLRSDAPDEISSAAGTLADNMQQLTGAIKAADYDSNNANVEFLADPDSAMALSRALGELDSYTERECGIPFGSAAVLNLGDGPGSDGSGTGSDSGGGSDGGSGSDSGLGTDDPDFDKMFRDELMKQYKSAGFTDTEAECLIDALDFLNADTGVDDMVDAFSKCNIDPARLANMGG